MTTNYDSERIPLLHKQKTRDDAPGFLLSCLSFQFGI